MAESNQAYPEGVVNDLTFHARKLDSGVWEVHCREWNCTLHNRTLLSALCGLALEIELHNRQEETGKVEVPERPEFEQQISQRLDDIRNLLGRLEAMLS